MNTKLTSFAASALVLGGGIALLAACTSGPAEKQQTRGDQVLATVNGTSITKADLDYWLLGGHGQVITPELRQQALEKRIDAELLYQRGLKVGLDQDKKYTDMIRALELRLAAAKRQELMRRVYNIEVAAKITVTDQQVQRYFDEKKDQVAAEYHLYGITFRTAEQAQAAQTKLAEGVAFETVAQAAMPPHPTTTTTPWDLGWHPWRQLPAEWATAVVSLAPGKTSDLIHGKRTGIRLLKLVEKRSLPNVAFADLRAVLTNRLRDELVEAARQTYLAELRRQATISYADTTKK